MRKLVLLLLIIPNISYSQEYLLLDRKWNKMPVLTDSVLKEYTKVGFYPIYTNELDSLINAINTFKDLKNDGLRRKFYDSESLKTEHLSFEIDNIRRAYGDGYEINLTSISPFGKYTLKLSDPRLNLPDNQSVIRNFLKYLNITKSNLESPEKRKKLNWTNNPLVN